MTFAVKEVWEINRYSTMSMSGQSNKWRLPNVLGKVGAARPKALMATVFVHILIALVIMSHLLNPTLAARLKGAHSALLAFDIGDAAEAAAQQQSVSARDIRRAPVDTPPVQAPLEWSATRIVVYEEMSSTNSSANVQAASGSQGSASSNTAAGSGFDPYIGAAPNRPGETYASKPLSPIGPAAPAPINFAARVTDGDAIVRAFRADNPNVKGSARLTVAVDNNGIVTSIVSFASAMSPPDAALLRRYIIGFKLGSARGTVVDLGPMTF